MQIVGLILCAATVLLGCILAFVRRRGDHQVLAFIADVVVTCVVLAAFITGIFGYRNVETQVQTEAPIQDERNVPVQPEVNVQVR